MRKQHRKRSEEDWDSLTEGEKRAREDRIRKRAHEIHLRRGGGPGRELDDWLQAERETDTDMGRYPDVLDE